MTSDKKFIFEGLWSSTQWFKHSKPRRSGGHQINQQDCERLSSDRGWLLYSVRVLPASFWALLWPSEITHIIVCILICSFLGRGRNEPSERLAWIHIMSNSIVYQLLGSAAPIILDYSCIYQKSNKKASWKTKEGYRVDSSSTSIVLYSTKTCLNKRNTSLIKYLSSGHM